MHKAIIHHCQAILSKHHALARGSFKPDTLVRVSTHSVTDYPEEDDLADLSEPVVVVDEHELLENYFKENKITLRLLYKYAGGIYLKTEYNLFAVLSFLCIFRLAEDDLSFDQFAKFIKPLDPTKMARFLAFMFDGMHLVDDGILTRGWATVLDREYIKAKLLCPMLKYSADAKYLVEDLIQLSEKGMIPKKSTKPKTRAQPFTLTVPSPRKPPELEAVPLAVTKARPIPKSFYSGTGELEALEKAKLENRRRVQEEYAKSQKTQFQLTKRAMLTPASGKAPAVGSETVAGQQQPLPLKAKPAPPSLYDTRVKVKTTVATVLREDAFVRRARTDLERAAELAERTLTDGGLAFRSWQDELKIKELEEKKVELEKLRLKVQLVHEDSFLARQAKVQENKDTVLEVKEEKEAFKSLSDSLRRELELENRKKIDNVHEIIDSMAKAKELVVVENQKKAADVMIENQMLKEKAHREAEEVLAKKIELIQQIRLLEKAIPPTGTLVKVPDLTESSNLGLLGEMSIAELQERLSFAKACEAERAEEKRQEIITHKTLRLQQISEKLEEIEYERQERRRKRHEASRGVTSSRFSSVASDDANRAFERETVDPILKEMQERLIAKRALRVAAKNELAQKKRSGNISSFTRKKLEPPGMDADLGQHADLEGIAVLKSSTRIGKLANVDEADDLDSHQLHLRGILQEEKKKLLHELETAALCNETAALNSKVISYELKTVTFVDQ
ncbi:hypothetical protein HDU82_000716 [Entophlyctis luteolus]|nr:hypothetical protein HDU82_000716 [Entophlyctis luteolus]